MLSFELQACRLDIQLLTLVGTLDWINSQNA